ncbi:metallo-mystery pair system four-Cys motif protein [Pseudanabaenaceae cyanobacterium LEGE 13415]|nr:metallo-mystery pair system four-Cys motif protein [Pseudanabaenaceae cyanobacterium LEGE 13415]
MTAIRFTIKATIAIVSLLAGMPVAQSAPTQPVTLRFAAKVENQPFTCGSTYRLGKPATPQTASDFRFYISDVALIDAQGKTVPVTLEQDGKWQYQTVALLDFENKTGACVNGTTEMRDRVVGTVPKGNYKGLKFTLGIPFNLNHDDSALAPSPLNLTGLWWKWQFGYKFVRIDLQSPNAAMPKHEETSGGFPIHLGSAGCEMKANSDKPTRCSSPNRATVTFTRFDPAKNVVVADLARLVTDSNLTQNQAKTAPGCMSEPNDRDCVGIMANLGLPFMKKPATTQTFFRVE